MIEQRAKISKRERSSALSTLSDFVDVHTGPTGPSAAPTASFLAPPWGIAFRSTLEEGLQTAHFTAEQVSLFATLFEQARDAIGTAVVFVDVPAPDSHGLEVWFVVEHVCMGLFSVLLEGPKFSNLLALYPEQFDVAHVHLGVCLPCSVHGLQFEEAAEIALLLLQGRHPKHVHF